MVLMVCTMFQNIYSSPGSSSALPELEAPQVPGAVKWARAPPRIPQAQPTVVQLFLYWHTAASAGTAGGGGPYTRTQAMGSMYKAPPLRAPLSLAHTIWTSRAAAHNSVALHMPMVDGTRIVHRAYSQPRPY